MMPTVLQAFKMISVAVPLIVGLLFWVKVFDLNRSHWPNPRIDKTMKFYPASLLILGISIIIAVELFRWMIR